MGKRKVCLSFNALALFRYFVLINILVLAVLVITGTSLKIILIVIGLVNAYYIATLTFKRLPIKILVDQELKVLIIESLHVIQIEKKQYNINELTYSYKEEMRAKGILVKVLRVKDAQGENILELIPNYNGWSEGKLIEILETLRPQ
ncbi:MAG: hypothetical protein U0289_17760 [Cyclobacteriaceae bacterium]